MNCTFVGVEEEEGGDGGGDVVLLCPLVGSFDRHSLVIVCTSGTG